MYSNGIPVSDKYHNAIHYMQQQTGFPPPMSVEPGPFGPISPPHPQQHPQRVPPPVSRRSVGEYGYSSPARPVNPFSRPQQPPERSFPSRRNSAPPPETPWVEDAREPGYRARRRSSGKRSQGSGRQYGSVKSNERWVPVPDPASPSRRVPAMPRAQTFGPASTPRAQQDFDPGSPRFRYGPQSTSQHHISRETFSDTHSHGRSYEGSGKKMAMARGSRGSGSLGSSSSAQFRRRSNIEGDQHIWRPRSSRTPRTPKPHETPRTPRTLSNASARPKLALLGFTSDDEAAYEAELSDQKVSESSSDEEESDGSKDGSDDDSSEEEEDDDEAKSGDNAWALTVSRAGVETISESPEVLSENDGPENAIPGAQHTSLEKVSEVSSSSSTEEDDTTEEDSSENDDKEESKPASPAQAQKKIGYDTTDSDGNSVKVQFHQRPEEDTEEDPNVPVITGRISEEDDDDDDDDDSDEDEESDEDESEETSSEEEESEDSDQVPVPPHYRQHQREQYHEREGEPEYQFGTIFESDNEESTSSDEDYDEEPHGRAAYDDEAYYGSEYCSEKPSFQSYVARRRSGGGHGEEVYSRGVYDNLTPEYSYGRAWRW